MKALRILSILLIISALGVCGTGVLFLLGSVPGLDGLDPLLEFLWSPLLTKTGALVIGASSLIIGSCMLLVGCIGMRSTRQGKHEK
ncbi:MAG: hypothetical protein ACFFCS_25070 [Candidatus Hodarchaeota archaeon]